MESSQAPSLKIATKILPKPLLRSLKHIFAQEISGCVLAGGTALAGFYAGHRRSDDLDFFTATETDQRAAVLAVKSLTRIGASLNFSTKSKQYFEALASLGGHRFKVTVVLDPNLFRVGRWIKLKGNIQVVTLDTLLKMKSATLVSRCSEKDLFDLIWLFKRFKKLKFAHLIRMGNEIDAGVDGEAILSSVEGSILMKKACDFSLTAKTKVAKIYEEILKFREKLLQDLVLYLEQEPTLPLGELVRKLRDLN